MLQEISIKHWIADYLNKDMALTQAGAIANRPSSDWRDGPLACYYDIHVLLF